jgi:hypothetical protein
LNLKFMFKGINLRQKTEIQYENHIKVRMCLPKPSACRSSGGI